MIHDVGIKKFLAAFITFLVLAFGASCSSGETNTQKATQSIESST